MQHKLQMETSPLAVYQNDQRWIRPYIHVFAMFAPPRMAGRTIFNVYCTEFCAYEEAYYTTAIKHGMIRVNNNIVSSTKILKEGDHLQHYVHRHEPPITFPAQNRSTWIVFENEDLVVVNKPATLPVHPCGVFRYNSVLHLLEMEDNRKESLHVVHRLDRLTSGVVILAKSKAMAQSWGTRLAQHAVEKVYLARVEGKFILQEMDTFYLKVKAVENEEWEVSGNIRCVSSKENRQDCHPDGKVYKF